MAKLLKPSFQRFVVQEHLREGYWIEAFKTFDEQIDLVAYGLNKLSPIHLYKNPSWEKAQLSIEKGPVGMIQYDINGDGSQDIVICNEYGKTMEQVDIQGGKIHWLQNPGAVQKTWKKHYIGRSTAMHRLAIGHFTQCQTIQLIGLPIVERPHDIHSIVTVNLWRKPKHVESAQEWHQELVDNCHFRVIHEVSVNKYNKLFGIHPQSNLDSLLIASEEGINWLYYNSNEKRWRMMKIGSGEHSQWDSTAKNPGFKGSGGVASGRIGNDPCAYIAAIQPFHGNTIAVYYKVHQTGTNNAWPWEWRRVVLDTFDNPNQKHEGPCHYVVCADMDGDGDDEFLVTLRGPQPWQGVYYYKAIDVAKGAWVKWKVSNDSAARIAIADFNNSGRLDFATIGYAVQGYFVTKNPSIVIYYNDFAKLKHSNQCKSIEPQLSMKNQDYQHPEELHEIPFSNEIKAIWLKYHKSYHIDHKSIVINLGSSTVTIGSAQPKTLASRQSVILQNTELFNVSEVLIFPIVEDINIGKSAISPDWQLLGNVADFPKTVPLWKSKQYDLGIILMDPLGATGQQAYSKSNERKYRLKINLWYCPSKTNCGLHNFHSQPHDIFEVHTQIYGVGVMQKFQQKDWTGESCFQPNKPSLTYEEILSQGVTHVPFASLNSEGEFVYPWHQYYGETQCIWIAHEYHVIQ